MEEWAHCRRELREINEKLTRVRIEIAELKVKSGVWGLAGGMISIAIMIAVELILKK